MYSLNFEAAYKRGFDKFTHTYLCTRGEHKGFKGTVVNRTFLTLHAGSLQITFTVPLIRPCLNDCGFIDDWGLSREWKFPFYISVHILRILNINNDVRVGNSCIVNIEINA